MLLTCLSMSAQDIITKKSGESVQAIVTEVTSETISYKRFSNPSGPTFVISVSDVSSILYENGERDVFTSHPTSVPTPVRPVLRQDLKYRDLKDMYNPRAYVKHFSDPHSPAWCGIGSFIIPGLGQMCCGEWGRGLLFLVGNAGCYYAAVATQSQALVLAQIVLDVWAIVDAVKVAKVINMYSQDLKGLASLDVDLYPNLAYTPTASGLQPTAGLTLAISF